MGNGFVMLWQKTLLSSLWRNESMSTRIVWITLLMMKDSEGRVISSKPGLRDTARVSDNELEVALGVLMAPDPASSSKAEEGRRIVEIPGGWRIVNHDLYRFSTEAKRAYWRETKAKYRQKTAPRRRRQSLPMHGEAVAIVGGHMPHEYGGDKL